MQLSNAFATSVNQNLMKQILAQNTAIAPVVCVYHVKLSSSLKTLRDTIRPPPTLHYTTLNKAVSYNLFITLSKA